MRTTYILSDQSIPRSSISLSTKPIQRTGIKPARLIFSISYRA